MKVAVAEVVGGLVDETIKKHEIKCADRYDIKGLLMTLVSESLEELGYHVFDLIREEQKSIKEKP